MLQAQLACLVGEGRTWVGGAWLHNLNADHEPKAAHVPTAWMLLHSTAQGQPMRMPMSTIGATAAGSGGAVVQQHCRREARCRQTS